MKKSEKTMKSYNIRFPDGLMRRLQAKATELEKSVSEIVRDAVREYIDND